MEEPSSQAAGRHNKRLSPKLGHIQRSITLSSTAKPEGAGQVFRLVAPTGTEALFIYLQMVFPLSPANSCGTNSESEMLSSCTLYN